MADVDMTQRAREAWEYYDRLLREKLDHIAELAQIERDKLIPINPADFLEKMGGSVIRGYRHKDIGQWIADTKQDGNYLISPLDADEETANQIRYKERNTEEKLRASKCTVMPISSASARRFFVKNHRQSIPNLTTAAISYALVYKGVVKAVMTYDFTAGAVRGAWAKDRYELLRLAIAHGTQINGGASRLQKHCEAAIRYYGVTEIYSYSNATINNGGVYKQLGFSPTKVYGGQPFVIMKDYSLVRLVILTAKKQSTNAALIKAGRLKTHISGNRCWTKNISIDEQTDEQQQ